MKPRAETSCERSLVHSALLRQNSVTPVTVARSLLGGAVGRDVVQGVSVVEIAPSVQGVSVVEIAPLESHHDGESSGLHAALP